MYPLRRADCLSEHMQLFGRHRLSAHVGLGLDQAEQPCDITQCVFQVVHFFSFLVYNHASSAIQHGTSASASAVSTPMTSAVALTSRCPCGGDAKPL
jgi:hypothetical protein